MTIHEFKPIFFIFLATLSPFLSFISKNLGELYFYDFIYISFYFLFVFFLSFLIFFFINKRIKNKINDFYLIFCYLILIFFNYHIIYFTLSLINLNNFINIRVFAHIFWFLIFFALIFYSKKIIKNIFVVTFSMYFLVFINLISSISIFYQFITIKNEKKETIMNNFDFSFDNIEKEKLKNVYYIIFDQYSRSDVYKKFYNFDNSYFLNEIKENNFKVIENSATNVTDTPLVMTSVFSMELDEIKKYLLNNSTYELGAWKIGNSKVQKIFKLAGYKLFISLENTVHGTPCGRVNLKKINIDKCISQKVKLAELEFNLLKLTPVFDILGKFFPNFFTYYILYPDYVAKQLHSAIPKDEKIFHYMHFYMPHPPPKFNENCRKELQILDFEGWGPTGKYLSVDAIKHIKQDVKCINKQILKLIKTIEKYDPDSIVVIQSDGSNVFYEFPFTHYNLNLWKLPKNCKSMISNNFTNVNTFRLIFNCLGIGNWEFEKNEIIDSRNNSPVKGEDPYETKFYDLLDEELKMLEKKF